MASTSELIDSDGEDQEELEFERFDDFTLASSWERFISEIEAVCRQWLADGPKNLMEKGAVHLGFSNNLYKVKVDLKYAMKSYSMEYYFEDKSNDKIADWNITLHDLQLSFGVKEFLVISPQSASGVVLDAPEATKLLSAVAIAMSNCSSLWSAFVPVHDPSRKAYIGIQDMGTVFTRRFEADRIASQVPVKLMTLEGLYELFVSKFAYSSLDFAMDLFKVHFTMKLTYKTLPFDEDDDTQVADGETTETGEGSGGNTHNRIQWDDDCSWSEWYSAEDPVKGFELISIWSEKIIANSMEMAEIQNATPHEAEQWILVPNFSPNLIPESKGKSVGFSSQLNLLINALDMPFEAQFMEDFVSVENLGSDNLKSSTVMASSTAIPPPTVIDRVLKDLFHEEARLPDSDKGEHKCSRAIKGAPLESLFAQFCLHSLWFGNCNIRAIAVLWIEFVREVRWCWEESQPLPKMPDSGVIDLPTCLINQKLQLLAICIEKKRQLNEDYHDCIDDEDHVSTQAEDGQAGKSSHNVQEARPSSGGKNESNRTSDDMSNPRINMLSSTSGPKYATVSADLKTSNFLRRGSAGVVESIMLLKTRENMHAPFTQDPPLMTEDMHQERIQAIEASPDSFSFSAQLEKDTLTSDMSAFKAANPNAVFEDFIRWHSPRDWEENVEKSEVPKHYTNKALKKDWPPRGRLSRRMEEGGNSWRKMWNNAPTLPASEQKPLFDPNREGEKVIHYLETLRPHQLLEQLVCTAFRAAADTLNQTNFGGLKQMTTKMEQLYLTMASTLRPFKGNHVSNYGEIVEDLRRLCTVFEHVERLLTLAASLHRKFLQAPRLAEGFFSDFYDSYLPKMGIASDGVELHMKFNKKQKVRYVEREVVANMFIPPTPNQSWRKALNMGNLLNGHEPMLREIIFSTRERSQGAHYAAAAARKNYDEDVETYRMYIAGTSNDLHVALSVASYD